MLPLLSVFDAAVAAGAEVTFFGDTWDSALPAEDLDVLLVLGFESVFDADLAAGADVVLVAAALPAGAEVVFVAAALAAGADVVLVAAD